MPHLIILEKNRDLMKLGADASCQLTEIHEAYEAKARRHYRSLIESNAEAIEHICRNEPKLCSE